MNTYIGFVDINILNVESLLRITLEENLGQDYFS